MNKKKSIAYAGLTLMVCGVLLSPALSAAADDSPVGIYDANELVQKVSPDIAAETATGTGSPLVPVQSNASAPQLVVDPQRVDSAPDPAVAEPGQLTATPEVRITPAYVDKKVDDANGMSVWSTESDKVAAYVQPISNGVRVLTAIASADAPRSYDYKLDIPAGSSLNENKLGFLVVGPQGEALGQLLAPWAKDANGKDLPTAYSLSGDTLTQTVNLDAQDIAYPVLADPAWTYVHHALIPSKNPSQIRSKLLNCFNCYFPVEGAPRNFPSEGQSLPLLVRVSDLSPWPWNFHCIMGTTHYYVDGNKSWFGYYFQAASDHVDGAGSTISFDFNPYWTTSNPTTIQTDLVVSGWIMNTDPIGLGQPAYVLAASATWNRFAINLDNA